MLKREWLGFLIILSIAFSNDKQHIEQMLEDYNKAFVAGNYSEIIKFFDSPTSFNLENKTIISKSRFKLKIIYKKIKGALPKDYAYSKWDKLEVHKTDHKIAIVYADFSRYNHKDEVIYSGSGQYSLRLKNNQWKIFSLTPYQSLIILGKKEQRVQPN